MRLKKIDVGGIEIPNNLILAPLAGYTNAPFRDMCLNFGAGLAFTEMVSAKGLCYNSEKTEALLYTAPDFKGVAACQIFGNDPEYMRTACESEALKPFKIIDLNMGCPVPKIFKNGEGSALLNDMRLAGKIIEECKKSGKAVTVKFRIGLTEGQDVAAEFARVCEGSGADMITVHGRTRDKMYSGEVNYGALARAKNAVKIPVIANGGVFSDADADALMERTGADGVAVARGAMYSPWIFYEIANGREASAQEKKQAVERQLAQTQSIYGERFTCVFMRKMISFYLKGKQNGARLREKLLACKTCAEIEEILKGLNF